MWCVLDVYSDKRQKSHKTVTNEYKYKNTQMTFPGYREVEEMGSVWFWNRATERQSFFSIQQEAMFDTYV